MGGEEGKGSARCVYWELKWVVTLTLKQPRLGADTSALKYLFQPIWNISGKEQQFPIVCPGKWYLECLDMMLFKSSDW